QLIVIVDGNYTIAESSEANNAAMATIMVYEAPVDLIIDGSNSPYVIESWEELSISGNVFVLAGGEFELNGTLNLINGGFFRMKGGEVRSEGGALTSGNTSSLSMEILSGTVFLNESTMPTTTVSGGTFTSTNATYASLTFTGGIGTLTNVTPMPAVSDSAFVEAYWYLTVHTVDAGGTDLPAASVFVKNLVDSTLNNTGLTGADGTIVFTLLGTEWNGSLETFYGSYSVSGTFNANVSDVSKSAIMNYNQYVTLNFSTVTPDAYVYEVGFDYSTSPVVAGQAIDIWAIVNNTGPTWVYGSLTFYIGGNATTGTFLDNIMDVAISPGGSLNLSIPWDTTEWEGSWNVYAVLEGLAADPTPTNNENNETITIEGSRPDFEVLSITYPDGTTGVIGSSVTVSVTVKNNGTSDLLPTEYIFIRLYDESATVEIGKLTIYGLAVGEEEVRNFAWTLTSPVGTHDLNATADYHMAVEEIYEYNNDLIDSSFTVLGKANLTVDAVVFDIMEPIAGDTVNIALNLWNHGQALAVGTVNVTFWDGDHLLGGLIGFQEIALNLAVGA
ncbi:MAG: hypothetical protein KAT70_01110, partial [Thermoplasmata archaeon]|nr:hypothetical protein [Thermoplasmata archaeon]